tara:strand:+ start:13080 stop:15029 length:1950 start_codon:yes stop_codon:yes gene_type:complete
MQRLFRNFALPVALLAATACSSNGSSTDAAPPDAEPVGICTPAMVLSAYPANFSGDVVGAGADLDVAEGVCDVEFSYYAQAGEDQVVELASLTPAANYVVIMESEADLSFYVVSDCTGADPIAGECLVFTDAELADTPEVAEFTAPASGQAFVIVDHFATEEPLAAGAYAITVIETECRDDVDCSGSPATPYCSDFQCVACANSFQCETAEASVCDETSNTCVPGSDTCTPDDTSETGDDGPAGARVIAAPTAQTPTVVTANICSDPSTELDFYQVDLAEGVNVAFALNWTEVAGAPDLDLLLFDADGNIIDSSFNSTPEVLVVENVAAGTYYLAVSKFEPSGTPVAASVPYTLSAVIPECVTSFDCTTAGEPVCSPGRTCIAGGNVCTGDTDDAISQNDGPFAATVLAVNGPAVNAAICNTPEYERDFFSVTVGNGQSLTLNIAYAENEAADLDVTIYNSAGERMGFALWSNPEVIELSFLPAGTYFVEVEYFGAGVGVAHPYTIQASASIGACTSDAQCDDVFKTQLFRGDCNLATGACEEIAGNGSLFRDAGCDSDTDCASGICSYRVFQAGAAESVCTVACNISDECVSAHGAGFSCTVPFANNFCRPDCSADLDCGANPSSAIVDDGEPWDYLSCNAGACELDN